MEAPGSSEPGLPGIRDDWLRGGAASARAGGWGTPRATAEQHRQGCRNLIQGWGWLRACGQGLSGLNGAGDGTDASRLIHIGNRHLKFAAHTRRAVISGDNGDLIIVVGVSVLSVSTVGCPQNSHRVKSKVTAAFGPVKVRTAIAASYSPRAPWAFCSIVLIASISFVPASGPNMALLMSGSPGSEPPFPREPSRAKE